MNITTIKNFIQELDRKEFKRYMMIGFAIFCVLIGLLIFMQKRKISNLESKLRRINQQRDEVRSILQEHALINQQRAAVDAILAKDKNFKITQYFDNLVKELGLTRFMTKEPTPDERDLNNGYDEIQLDATFKDMDMRQVTELLYKIEQNDRVYTKELALIKPPKSSKLDVSITIATLQPKITS
jgi:uncharacterized membrane protein YhiD involved in acid resistance